MTRNGAILYFCGPFADRDGLRNLPAPVFKDMRVLRPAYAALGSQVVLKQISGWLRTQYPDDESMRVSHEPFSKALARSADSSEPDPQSGSEHLHWLGELVD